MQQPQRCIEQVHQIRASCPGRALVGAFIEVYARLDQFQIPVAELAPEKVVNAVGRFMKTICLQRTIHVGSNSVEARKNPAVLESCSMKPGNTRVGTAALGCL